MKRLLRWGLAVVAGLVVLVVGGFALVVHHVRAQTAAAESRVTAVAAYKPAAKALAALCQSDPFFFRDEPPFAPAWTPPEVLKLNPTWVDISPDRAHVEFGGGFHHFGYELKRDKAADNGKLNGWVLEFYSEDSPNRRLETFTVDQSEHVELRQFVKGALAEFERRAAISENSESSVNERLIFLLKFNKVGLARQSIHDCAAANPNDWADQLLAYIVDAKALPAASGRLDAWAQKKDDCAAWLMAAYAYDVVNDYDSAERCVKRALTKPVDDPDWVENNARYRGATVGLQLLKARRYQTCSALCDALLRYDGGDYLVPQITAIRDRARRAAASGPPPKPPAFEEGTVFEPFKGIDLSRLMVSKAIKSPASSQPSGTAGDPKAARLIEYFDHRIAAEPGVRRNYSEKIDYLQSIKRDADVLSACKDAAQAFPNWWKPQMALAVLSGAGSRGQAGAAFHKWVEDHPAFIHWWYLCRYDRDLGRNGDAVAALRSAVKYPLESVDDDEDWVPAAFAFDAARYAYEQKQYTLVLDIARVWSSPRGVYNYFDDDIYAFRAAAELALGQFTAAKADADRVIKAASEHALWADHLVELQKAADGRDRNFKYDPGSSGGDWSLFPMPRTDKRD